MGWVTIKNTMTNEVTILGDGIDDAYGEDEMKRAANRYRAKAKAVNEGAIIPGFLEIKDKNL